MHARVGKDNFTKAHLSSTKKKFIPGKPLFLIYVCMIESVTCQGAPIVKGILRSPCQPTWGMCAKALLAIDRSGAEKTSCTCHWTWANADVPRWANGSARAPFLSTWCRMICLQGWSRYYTFLRTVMRIHGWKLGHRKRDKCIIHTYFSLTGSNGYNIMKQYFK